MNPNQKYLVDSENNKIYDLDLDRVMDFKGHKFNLRLRGTKNPFILLSSFKLENKIRDKWWNINKGDVVLDIGAAWGSYTLTALAQGANYVIAIDPDRESYFDLETNLFINSDFRLRCNHMPIMIGASFRETNFYSDTHSCRSDKSLPEERITMTVDSICTVGEPLDRLDWVKVDVEGMELDVLGGARESIDRYRPKLLIENHVCFDEAIPNQVREFMSQFSDYREETDESDDGNWSLWCPN